MDDDKTSVYRSEYYRLTEPGEQQLFRLLLLLLYMPYKIINRAREVRPIQRDCFNK